jgi:hypothetical protein
MYTQSKEVSHEQYKDLKSIGMDFIIPVKYFMEFSCIPSYKDTHIIPTIPEAIRWCADKLQVYAYVGKYFTPEIHSYGQKFDYHEIDYKDYDSYEEAENELLKNLIILLQNKSN